MSHVSPNCPYPTDAFPFQASHRRKLLQTLPSVDRITLQECLSVEEAVAWPLAPIAAVALVAVVVSFPDRGARTRS